MDIKYRFNRSVGFAANVVLAFAVFSTSGCSTSQLDGLVIERLDGEKLNQIIDQFFESDQKVSNLMVLQDSYDSLTKTTKTDEVKFCTRNGWLSIHSYPGNIPDSKEGNILLRNSLYVAELKGQKNRWNLEMLSPVDSFKPFEAGQFWLARPLSFREYVFAMQGAGKLPSSLLTPLTLLSPDVSDLTVKMTPEGVDFVYLRKPYSDKDLILNGSMRFRDSDLGFPCFCQEATESTVQTSECQYRFDDQNRLIEMTRKTESKNKDGTDVESDFGLMSFSYSDQINKSDFQVSKFGFAEPPIPRRKSIWIYVISILLLLSLVVASFLVVRRSNYRNDQNRFVSN